MPEPSPVTDLDRALICAYSILSLLHHRGIVDSELNREDVAAALDKLRPFSMEAERRMMRGRSSA